MIQRPTTFGELIARFLPEPPADAYRLAPVVGSAVEMAPENGGKSPRFWVLIHSVTDSGVVLLHQHRLRSRTISVRLAADSGEAVQALLAVSGSQPRGELFETTAQFQHAGLDVGQLS